MNHLWRSTGTLRGTGVSTFQAVARATPVHTFSGQGGRVVAWPQTGCATARSVSTGVTARRGGG